MEEPRQGYSKTLRNRKGGLDCKVVLPPFDPTHVRAMQTAVIGKRLLGEALLSPKITNSLAEDHL